MTTWTYDGTDLSTLGNITKLDENFDMPDRRGNNIVVPYRHGSVHADKYFDERTITFGIAVMTASASALETRMDTIFSLFTPQQQVLQVTREDSTVRTVLASVNKSIQTNRLDNRTARIVVEFTLAEPFFRLSTVIADNTVTPNSNDFHFHVTNPGTIEERDPTIILTGLYTTSTLITNSTNGCTLTYTGTIAATDTVTIETVAGEYKATHSVSGNVIGNITHSGSSALMVFDPGLNEMQIASAGQGANTRVKASFYAPYI